MANYSRITESVEAEQLTADNAEDIARWCGGQVIRETSPRDPEDVFLGVNVPTLNGNQRLTQGMFLVKKEDGTFDLRGATAFLSEYRKGT